jgi:hypothetical protein
MGLFSVTQSKHARPDPSRGSVKRYDRTRVFFLEKHFLFEVYDGRAVRMTITAIIVCLCYNKSSQCERRRSSREWFLLFQNLNNKSWIKVLFDVFHAIAADDKIKKLIVV